MPHRIPQASAPQQAVIEELSNLVHGISTPFVCSGTLVPEAPVTLRFKDGVQVPITRLERGTDPHTALEPLLARCSPAPFGKGRKTLYNRRVRDALHLKAEGGAFTVLNFDPAASGVLEVVRQQLCPGDATAPTAVLYNLNVYGTEGHFEPHKDTPRGSQMMGTLVVCLPSRFFNGQLVLTHRGAHKVFDWGQDISEQAEPSRIHWAAFFGDVDHAINKVWMGLRVTLTYLLYRGEGAITAPRPSGATTERLRQGLERALADRHFLPRGGVLGFPCFHMYSHEAAFRRSLPPLTQKGAALHRLKGRDAEVAAAALRAGLSVSLQPYLIELCADETWQLKRFPTEEEQELLDERLLDPWVLEKALPIAACEDAPQGFGVTWVISPPEFNGPVKPRTVEGDADSPSSEEPVVQLFHSGAYSATGYFGNEGGETDFYLYAALHVVILPLGKGPRQVTRAARKPARAGKHS
jgi:hypothetical protein